MNVLRNLQATFSKEIQVIIDAIDSLGSLKSTHKNLNFDEQILILEEEKYALITTQIYLEKCEKDLEDKVKLWLKGGCKGKIQISLKGVKK